MARKAQNQVALAEPPKSEARKRVEKRELGELGAAESTWLGTLKLSTYNPDDLVTAKGGLTVYQKMTADPVVKKSLREVILRVIALPWQITAATEDERDQDVADFVQWNFDNIEGVFSKDLWDLCDALTAGFSITEPVYQYLDRRPWAGRIGLKALKSKDPQYWGFKLDRFRNLQKLICSIDGKQEEFEPADFIVYSHLARYEDPHGQSELRAAYRAWWLKDTAMKLRAVFVERYANPLPVGKFPRGTKKEEVDKWLTCLKRIQAETAFVIPDDLALELKQITTATDQVFHSAIVDCNDEITSGILMATITGSVPEVGARSLGEVHERTRDLVVPFLAALIADTLNEQLVKRLVEMNFAVEEPPTFGFVIQESVDLERESRIDDTLVNRVRLPLSKTYFYEKYGRPEPEDEEELVEGATVPTAALFAEDRSNRAYRSYAEEDLLEQQQAGQLQRENADLDAVYSAARAQAMPTFETIFDAIEQRAERSGQFALDRTARDYGQIGKITGAINVGELQEIVERLIVTADLAGRLHSTQVMKRLHQRYAPPEEKRNWPEFEKFAESIRTLLTDTEARDILAGKIPMTRTQFNLLRGVARDKAFTVAGLAKNGIANDVQPLVLQAFDAGWDFDRFRSELQRKRLTYIDEVFGGGAEGEPISDRHAETIFRTNMMSAYNGGRRAAMEDPQLADMFPAWQYSAVMDGRTRPAHAEMDRKVFLKTDPIWKIWYPPNGYNCRCSVYPVVKWQLTPDMISDYPTGKPDVGFGG